MDKLLIALALVAMPALAILPSLVPPADAAKEPKAIVRSASGANPSDIQAAVNAFRADLGGVNNGNGAPSATGRREISWDGANDAVAAPNNLPPDFFNTTAPRGAVLGPGTLFQQSADGDNPTTTPIEFGNLNPTYTEEFSVFSAPRLFTALDSTITEVTFFVPGTNTPAVVKGFGAVFTDVERTNKTTIEYFDEDGKPIGKFKVPTGPDGGLSFLGASDFRKTDLGISRVRITTGTTALGPNETGNIDIVAMDDFIYGEPQEIP